MKHLFVPYELALKLKENGFNYKCLTFYVEGKMNLASINDGVGIQLPLNNSQHSALGLDYLAAPLYQQVIDWFRDSHDILITVSKDYHAGKFLGWEGIVEQGEDGLECTQTYPNYYEALNKAIEEALKLI